jgi:hypothetical protein
MDAPHNASPNKDSDRRETNLFGSIMKMATLDMNEVDELTTLTPRGEELSPRVDSPMKTIKLDLPREPLMSDSSIRNMERLLGEVDYESSTPPRASPINKNNRYIHKCVQINVCLCICTYIYVYTYTHTYDNHNKNYYSSSSGSKPHQSSVVEAGNDDRNNSRNEAIKAFEKRLSKLSEKSLLGLFNAVKFYMYKCMII